MKAKLVYWHKARLLGRYILEMEIHAVGKSPRYPDGVKYGLVLTDLRKGRQVLMDNHDPKGHHIHIDDREIAYRFVDEDKLIADFKELVLENMGVKI